MYKVININSWNRRKQYEWFSSFPNPCYGIDVKVDVTEIVNYSKETQTSFFINFLYIVTKSLNSIDELRLRIVHNEVRLYDTINPTYTVMTNAGTFENGGHKMKEDYPSFYKVCHETIERIKLQTSVKNGYNDDQDYDEYYMTCLPWLDYEGMTHPLPTNDPSSSSCPRICWGKYHLENGRYILSFNLTVSHALVDGYPCSCALNRVKENSLNPRSLFESK